MIQSQRFAACLAGGTILGILGGIMASQLSLPPERRIRVVREAAPSRPALTSGDEAPADASTTGSASPSKADSPVPTPTEPTTVTAAGKTFETTVSVDGIGEILIQVGLPESPRYADGAPVVVTVPTFFTPERSGFHPFAEAQKNGMISVTLMYPGRSNGAGASSAGTDDYGGANSIKALRDAVLFALGEKTNAEGYLLDQLSAVKPLYENVGLYAFSHPGLAATNVLGTYASELKNVRFLVGYENPTQSLFAPLELGHYETEGKRKIAVNNAAYQYPDDYSPTNIQLDYSSVRYDAATSRPYFDLNGNGMADASGDYLFGEQIPTFFGKRTYSAELLRALRDSGSLTAQTWPSDLSTPEEAEAIWPSRQSTGAYPKLAGHPNLHVILVFAVNGHVQAIPDNPNIHQSFDGLRAAGIWTRLNPDASYVSSLSQTVAAQFQEHDANAEPSDWMDSDAWSFPNVTASSTLVPLAAVLELADRSHANNWSTNLSSVIN